MARVSLFLLLVLHLTISFASTDETVVEETVVGEILPNIRPEGSDGHRRVRRLASESIMTEAEKTAILNKHNELRGQTIPAAANMRFMEWDDTLATHAQQYSDMCVWAHGFPEENITPFDPVGQNLWVVGPVSEAFRPDLAAVTQSWYNEDRHYNHTTGECKTGEMCGHYTQVVWADSYAVGCSMTFCPTTAQLDTDNVLIVNCHYGPAGNYGGALPYISGMPCTKCITRIGQCYNNQCRLCSTHSEECVCRQICENCGTLDTDMCKCSCPLGYHGGDCSKDCEDDDGCGNGALSYSNCDKNPHVQEICPVNCDMCIPFKDPNFVCVTATPTTGQSTTTPTTTVPPTTVQATTIPATTVPSTSVMSPTTSATTAAPTTTLSSSCPSLICENGGTLQLSACNCICKAEYQGTACQHLREEARRGVLFMLVADIADWTDIKTGLLDAVAEVLTTYCNGDAFQTCCPGKGNKMTAVKLAFVSSAYFSIATGYPEIYPDINSQPAFVTMILSSPPVTSELCNGGTLSRKRRDAKLPHVIHRREPPKGAFLDQDVLLKAVEGGLADIRQSLSQLNVTVTLNSVAAGKEEPLPPIDNNGLIIAIIVVLSIIALVAIILIAFFVFKNISKKQKVTQPMALH